MYEIDSEEEFHRLIENHNKGVIGPKNISLMGYTINCELYLSATYGSVRFFQCTFKENFTLRSSVELDVSFRNSVFEKNAAFQEARFKSKARFIGTKFKGKAFFDNTRFENLADFWGAEFFKPTIFYKTDFLGVTVFSITTFYENVLFTYSSIEKVMILRGTNFKAGLDLSLIVSDPNISLFDIRLPDYKAEPDTDDDNYEESIAENAIIHEKNKEETFRLLKKQLLAQGNHYEAIHFKGLELDTYYSRLKKDKRKRWQDYLIFWLNHISNNNNRSWITGILFTILTGLLFFSLAAYDTDGCKSLSEFVKYYFIFITPTHSLDLFKDLHPGGVYYLWDFLSRIFVSYGIYQTVQAFRKFKGN